MKTVYELMEFEVITFDKEDVIMTSGGGPNGEDHELPAFPPKANGGT